MAEVPKGTIAEESGVADLLSIDADAHLQKLAACMFPTPAQLPVEMVRAAIRRGASSIIVGVRRGRLAVSDDGEGIAPGPWRELACALDAGRSAVEREKAMESLQRAAVPGIGLLAVFVPGARLIRIENGAGGAREVLTAAGGRVRLLASAPGLRGTHIMIARRRGPAERERKLLRELCAAAPQEITVNGRKIERKSPLRRTLVQQGVELGPGKSPALVAVPARGDACRIWLLDQRIPWQALSSAAYHGLVFEAALESGSPPAAAEFAALARTAGRLYQWLAENYLSFPEAFHERIEELLFRKARVAGDLRLPAAFTPFRLWRCRQRLNLEEVRRRAERHVLYALPADADPDRFLGRHHEALLLTPLQKDFLLNQLGLPLAAPAASMKERGRFSMMLFSARRRLAGLRERLPRPAPRKIAAASISDAERRLCREIEAFWARAPRHGLPLGFPGTISVAMAAGRGLAPARWAGGPEGAVLLLRRRHPLVAMAARSVAGDRANVELAFAALAPERSLTPQVH
jgi:hypothetical protein